MRIVDKLMGMYLRGLQRRVLGRSLGDLSMEEIVILTIFHEDRRHICLYTLQVPSSPWEIFTLAKAMEKSASAVQLKWYVSV
jgi:hypothetical protein